MESYDYVLVNDELSVCVEQLHGLIQSQHLKTSRNLRLLGQMREELAQLVK